MLPQITGWVPVVLDRPRRLLLDVAALQRIKTKLGADPVTLCIGNKLTDEMVPVLLWSMLLADDPGLTIEMAESFIEPKYALAIGCAIQRAIQVGMAGADVN